MPGPAFLRGERVTLRPHADGDEEHVLRAHNEPELRDGLLHDRPRTGDGLESFYDDVASDDDVALLVCVDDDGQQSDLATDEAVEVVGQVALFGMADDHGTVAYWILPEHQGEGYATEAMTLLLDYAFDTLGLHHVVAGVVDYNDASQALLEGLGFTLEGTRREHRFRRGRYCDLLQYGVLESEWRERREQK